MIDDFDKYLTKSIIGVRYRLNPKLTDSLGSVIDKILYADKTYFSPVRFPISQNSSFNERIICNNDRNDILKINTFNTQLEIGINERSDVQHRNKAFSAFNDQILQGIFKEEKITSINRIGFVNRYDFPIKRISRNLINSFLGESFENVNDIELRFSKKIMPKEASKKGIDNFENVIYSISKKTDQDNIVIILDFQKYFNPPLESSRGIDYEDFVGSMNEHLVNTFYTWINQFEDRNSE